GAMSGVGASARSSIVDCRGECAGRAARARTSPEVSDPVPDSVPDPVPHPVPDSVPHPGWGVRHPPPATIVAPGGGTAQGVLRDDFVTIAPQPPLRAPAFRAARREGAARID